MAQLEHPADLRYAKTHEWVRVNGDEATVGISDFAQDELGDVVSLDLPWEAAGREVLAGRHFGDIDSVKATSELFAPVSGQIVRVNGALKDHPEVVNSQPYGDGWMIVIKMSNPAEANALMTAEQYIEFIGSSGH
jgi:glycine cleavage system H protein